MKFRGEDVIPAPGYFVMVERGNALMDLPVICWHTDGPLVLVNSPVEPDDSDDRILTLNLDVALGVLGARFVRLIYNPGGRILRWRMRFEPSVVPIEEDEEITPSEELHRRRGTHPASEEDFERVAGHLPSDDDQRVGASSGVEIEETRFAPRGKVFNVYYNHDDDESTSVYLGGVEERPDGRWHAGGSLLAQECSQYCETLGSAIDALLDAYQGQRGRTS